MATMELIKDLRARTGCGVLDCKEALQEAGDDIEKAIIILRKKGKAQVAKKAGRATREGVVVSYVHSNNKLGVLVTVLCETDFVARNEKFQALAHDIAMHIAAADPLAISPDDIDASLIKAEQQLAQEQAAESGKPADIQAKMVEGKLNKFKAERALLKQPFVKDPAKTIEDLINETVQEIGENITVSEFSRHII
jgi:elongation factor Ts